MTLVPSVLCVVQEGEGESGEEEEGEEEETGSCTAEG